MATQEMTLTSPKVRSSSTRCNRLDANNITVRTTRARIIHLRNDYKALMSKIEVGLHEHHAEYQAANPPASSSTQAAGSNGTTVQGVLDTPFAKVNSVVNGSPADQAGLKVGDRIRKFGNVDFMNHEKLSKVAETVQRNQGVSTAIPWLKKALFTDLLPIAKRGRQGSTWRSSRSNTRRADPKPHTKKRLGRARIIRLPFTADVIGA